MTVASHRQANSPAIVTKACSAPDAGSETSIRDSFAHLPGQRLWTWITGTPGSGQTPAVRVPGWLYLAWVVVSIAAGCGLGVFAVATAPAGLLLLPVAWLAVVHGARALQVTVVHYAVHGQFARSETINRLVGEAISIALLITPFAAYTIDHKAHHQKELATENDPDVRFLVKLGFRTGVPFEHLQRHLRTRAFSLDFHTQFVRARLHQNLGGSATLRLRVAVTIWLTVQLLLVAWTGAWLEYLLVWVFPMTVLYHVSALWQFVGEHMWLRVDIPGEPTRVTLQLLTSGRFCGERAPATTDGAVVRCAGWAGWFLRMLLVHLPARLFVLAGDLSVHDWHHRHAKGDWRVGMYERQRDVDGGRPNYTEVWGIRASADRVMRFWSELPQGIGTEPLASSEERELFTSM